MGDDQGRDELRKTHGESWRSCGGLAGAALPEGQLDAPHIDGGSMRGHGGKVKRFAVFGNVVWYS